MVFYCAQISIACSTRGTSPRRRSSSSKSGVGFVRSSRTDAPTTRFMVARFDVPKRPMRNRVSTIFDGTTRTVTLGEAASTGPLAVPWRISLNRFVTGVRAAYGDRLQRVVLYGSRARGDAEP